MSMADGAPDGAPASAAFPGSSRGHRILREELTVSSSRRRFHPRHASRIFCIKVGMQAE
jgi:hypothetical protein